MMQSPLLPDTPALWRPAAKPAQPSPVSAPTPADAPAGGFCEVDAHWRFGRRMLRTGRYRAGYELVSAHSRTIPRRRKDRGASRLAGLDLLILEASLADG